MQKGGFTPMDNKKNNILGLFLCLFLITACSNTLQSVKEGETFSKSSDGLLVGTIRFQQGDRMIVPSGLGATQRLFIQSIEINKSFEHVLDGTDFRLTLPPGHYTVKQIFAYQLSVNKTTGAAVAPWLWNVLTLPFGVVTVPAGTRFNFYPPDSPFEIKQHEATYIGTLVVEIPDPLPMGSFTPTFRVIDEEEQASKDLPARFPGIERVNKDLLFEPRSAIAYYNRDLAYSKKGEYDKAIADNDKAIEIHPMYAIVYYNKALALEQAGHTREAVEAYKDFIQHTTAQSTQEIEDTKRRVKELEKRLN